MSASLLRMFQCAVAALIIFAVGARCIAEQDPSSVHNAAFFDQGLEGTEGGAHEPSRYNYFLSQIGYVDESDPDTVAGDCEMWISNVVDDVSEHLYDCLTEECAGDDNPFTDINNTPNGIQDFYDYVWADWYDADPLAGWSQDWSVIVPGTGGYWDYCQTDTIIVWQDGVERD